MSVADLFNTNLRYARTALALRHPFYTVLSLRIPVKLAEGETFSYAGEGKFRKHDTAWTDGVSVTFAAEFVARISRAEFLGVLMHELLHVVLMHHARMHSRQAFKWNVATDFAINLLVEEAGKDLNLSRALTYALPPGCLYDKKYEGMTAEEIYDSLPEQGPEDSSGEGGGEGTGEGEGTPNPLEGDIQAPANEKASSSHHAAEMRGVLAEAAQAAQRAGSLSAGIERLIGELLYPATDWRDVLSQFAQAFPVDFGYSPPDKRTLDPDLGYDFVLPSVYGEKVEGVVAVDLSGSISLDQARRQLSEIAGVFAAFDHVKLKVISFDTKVHTDTDVENLGELLSATLKGGGGTAFEPVFEYLETESPAFLIVMTDGYGSFPSATPAYPVIWGVHKSGLDHDKFPFGQVVTMQDPN